MIKSNGEILYNIVGISEKRQKGKFCLFLVFLLFSYWKIYGMLKLAKRDEDIYDKIERLRAINQMKPRNPGDFAAFLRLSGEMSSALCQL